MEESFSFQGILNDYLKKQVEERKDRRTNHFYASQLGQCKRKQIWKRMNEPESNPMDERTLRIMSVGDIFHSWLQAKAAEAGVLESVEKEIINEEYDYKGRYDALIVKNGKKLLYDFKTQHSQSFHYMNRNGIGVDDSKKMQIASYAIMGNLPVDECRLLFVSKDDLCLMEVPVKVEDWREPVITELKELNKFYKEKIIPEPLPEIENNKVNWQCLYCPYMDKCRGKNWESEVKSKIKPKIKKTKI